VTSTRIDLLRRRILDESRHAVLVSILAESYESQDNNVFLVPPGLSRIRRYREFRLYLSRARSINGHPIPLRRGLPVEARIDTHVFQINACNWHCWYCYVDDSRLAGQAKTGQFLSAEELVSTYRELAEKPPVIDLSGGEPDLTPEWTLWILNEVERVGLTGQVLVWQETNLSTRLLWEVLDRSDISYMAAFPGHSRVGCFKGFDEVSFAFNTRANPRNFVEQFEIFRNLVGAGFEMYAYATLTGPAGHCSRPRVASFLDRLQRVHPLLPLRTIPLRVVPFAATKARLGGVSMSAALHEQNRAGDYWDEELERRFSRDELQMPYEDVVIDAG